MSTYLLINAAILIFPLLFTFHKKIRYHEKWPAVFAAILWISPVYLIWDAVATVRGDWSFNGAHLLGIRFLGVPFEEVLFFVTVPYSCLFIYEILCGYLPDREVPRHPLVYRGVAGLLFILAGVYYRQAYTCTVLLFVGIFFVLANRCYPDLLKSRRYWIFIALTCIPFLIFNYILTSIPVVTYSDDAILGPRILTIPIEDFFYNFSLLSLYVLIYRETNLTH